MATKFASVYKQELKSKGVLSSMGSAVLKSARERMDVRNIFFGGKGMLSATGQKAFGRGYSALSSGAMPTPSNSQMAAQSAATGELISSNERQEALLRVVAKNTFNMNMMARDMNITRQNIATMTRVMAGKAAQSQDALWYDVKTRNQAIDSLGKKRGGEESTSPSKSSGTGVIGGIGSILGSIASFGGSVVTGALSAIARVSPILGIIALMAGGYVIKELAKVIDFQPLKEKIYEFLGLDVKSEKNVLQQWADKLDLQFDTKKFSEIYNNMSATIIKNFGPQIDMVGRGIAATSDAVLAYSKAAFRTLADGFGGIGKAIGFLLNEFFSANKGKILMAIAAGLAAGNAKDPRSAAAALAAIGVAGLFGAATGQSSREELKGQIDDKLKDLVSIENRINEATNAPDTMEGRAKRSQLPKLQEYKKALIEKLSSLGAELSGRENELRGYLTPDMGAFSKYVAEEESAMGGFGSRYRPVTPAETATGTAPTQVPSTNISSALSNVKWKDLSEEQKNALLSAQAQSEGYTPGKLPYELKNPGAMIYADWQTQFGGKRGRTVTDNFGITRTFTEFPTHEQGRAAQRWLWDNGKPAGTPGYANMTLLDAFKKWVAPHKDDSDGFQNYIGNVLRQIKGVPGVQISEMSSDLNSAQRTFMASSGGGGTTVVAPQNTTVVAGGKSQAFAGAIDAEAMYLFMG
jgi:hypothetical protein